MESTQDALNDPFASKVLINLRSAEPSYHPDERMNWSLKDMQKYFIISRDHALVKRD